MNPFGSINLQLKSFNGSVSFACFDTADKFDARSRGVQRQLSPLHEQHDSNGRDRLADARDPERRVYLLRFAASAASFSS